MIESGKSEISPEGRSTPAFWLLLSPAASVLASPASAFDPALPFSPFSPSPLLSVVFSPSAFLSPSFSIRSVMVTVFSSMTILPFSSVVSCAPPISFGLYDGIVISSSILSSSMVKLGSVSADFK